MGITLGQFPAQITDSLANRGQSQAWFLRIDLGPGGFTAQEQQPGYLCGHPHGQGDNDREFLSFSLQMEKTGVWGHKASVQGHIVELWQWSLQVEHLPLVKGDW